MAEIIEAIRARPGRAQAGLPFLLFLIPATAALAWTTRRIRPVLTTVGAGVALLGFLAAFPLLPGDDTTAWVTAHENLDVVHPRPHRSGDRAAGRRRGFRRGQRSPAADAELRVRPAGRLTGDPARSALVGARAVRTAQYDSSEHPLTGDRVDIPRV
jgi:hypothetical protein